jgi:LacI family transcriptional regulator
LHDEYLQQGDFLLESGYRCGLKLLQHPVPPTAILCCSNQMTLGLMRAMREMSISCPDRVSILGFDDFDWAENVNPRLTTVAQPMMEMGKQAMQMLLRRITSIHEGVYGEEEKVVLKTELRVRDSTAPPLEVLDPAPHEV